MEIKKELLKPKTIPNLDFKGEDHPELETGEGDIFINLFQHCR